MIMTPFWLQILSTLISILGIYHWVKWGRAMNGMWLYSVPPISWLVHVIIFYSVVLVYKFIIGNNEGAEWITLWSAALRLHAVILVTAASMIMLYFRRRKRGII